jgi:hypothetical protein
MCLQYEGVRNSFSPKMEQGPFQNDIEFPFSTFLRTLVKIKSSVFTQKA